MAKMDIMDTKSNNKGIYIFRNTTTTIYLNINENKRAKKKNKEKDRLLILLTRFNMNKTIRDNMKEQIIKMIKVDSNGKAKDKIISQSEINNLDIVKEPMVENGLKEFKLLIRKLPNRSTTVSDQPISEQSIDLNENDLL